MPAPDFQTLIDMLAVRAADSTARSAFTYRGHAVTFGELWQGVNRFGAFLLAGGLRLRECVVVALPNGPEFFPAFYGIQRAGGIAVPVFPGAGFERILGIARLCGARVIVVPGDLPPAQLAAGRSAAAVLGITVVTVGESAAFPIAADFPRIAPDDCAFIQYTSGSTGNPKGVMLSHANLLTNIRQMIAGMQISARDIFVSWLPVYHDMGLILKTMVPFYLPAETHLLASNLQDVRPWLETIQRVRATFTAAPDFGYRLCLRHSDPAQYDLSSLRVALNAAEPVRAATIRQFEQAFRIGPVMVAGYGLAEATVGVSMGQPQTPNRIDSHGRVSAGRPFPGVEVLIRDGDAALPPGQIGEIAIRSEANSAGYYRDAEETARLFWRDGYLLSGDLGYVDADGYLFVVSRKKNVIKRAGETIAPQEIEELADAVPGMRFSAALGIDRGRIEGEQVYVFAEVRDDAERPPEALHELGVQIVERIGAHMGFRPARAYLLKPRSIPLTHNGKIQHGRLKELYLSGALRKQGAILYPEY